MKRFLPPIFHVLILGSTCPAADEIPPLAPGEPVDYAPHAIQPEAWKARGLDLELVPWQGRKVVFLTVDETLDPELMGLWVSRLDAGWEVYADLTGKVPGLFRHIGGRATIAAVPDAGLTCGVGCGYIGVTGIELAKFYQSDYPELKASPGAMPHYVFYEMGRNFYTFGNRHSCFVTGFAVFMRYVCMDALEVEDPEAESRRVIESVESRFADSGLSFLELFTVVGGEDEKASLIRDAEGRLIRPSDQPVRYASAMLRLRRECGGDAWVRRFFRELAACPKFRPGQREGALNQGWYWLLSASVAAERDLSPIFADEWQLPLDKNTRDALAAVEWQKRGLEVADVAAEVKVEWKTGG